MSSNAERGTSDRRWQGCSPDRGASAAPTAVRGASAAWTAVGAALGRDPGSDPLILCVVAGIPCPHRSSGRQTWPLSSVHAVQRDVRSVRAQLAHSSVMLGALVIFE